MFAIFLLLLGLTFVICPPAALFVLLVGVSLNWNKGLIELGRSQACSKGMSCELRVENRELLAHHPGCREYILTVDRLERPLQAMIQTINGKSPVLPSSNASVLDGAELMEGKLTEMKVTLQNLAELLQSDLPRSWGDDGRRGDTDTICEVCLKIIRSAQRLVDAEHKILRTPMHPKLVAVQRRFQGVAHENLTRILQLVRNIRAAVTQGGKGTLDLEIILTTERLDAIKISDLPLVEIMDEFIGPSDSSTTPARVRDLAGEVLKEATKPKSIQMMFHLFLWALAVALFWWILLPVLAVRWMFSSKRPMLKV